MPLTFAPLSRDDFALMERWLSQPHVQSWWDPRHDPEFLEAKYGPRIDGADPTRVFTVRSDGEAVGLMQYTPGDEYAFWPSEHGLADSLVIDGLIGESQVLGQGLGSKTLLAFVEAAAEWTGVSRFAASTRTGNLASRRVLEKAGFQCVFEGDLIADDQPDRRIYALDVRR